MASYLSPGADPHLLGTSGNGGTDVPGQTQTKHHAALRNRLTRALLRDAQMLCSSRAVVRLVHCLDGESVCTCLNALKVLGPRAIRGAEG